MNYCYVELKLLRVAIIFSLAFSLSIAQTTGNSYSFPAQFNLSTLDGSNGFVVYSSDINDLFETIASGDINGDGVADFLIGGNNQKNQSYVIYGSRIPFSSNFDIINLNGSNGFIINNNLPNINNADNSKAIFPISSGDVNGDNITDILMSACYASATGVNNGQVYVIFGSKTQFPTTFNLNSLNGTNGFIINGLNNYDDLGQAISGGDINGDNITDILIGAPGYGSATGQSYVIYGSRNQFPAIFDLTSLNGTNGFVINGIFGNTYSGDSLSSGDINGDNITDILIGAPYWPGGATGQCYVIYGTRIPFPPSFNASSLNGTNGFIISNVNSYEYFGEAMSSGDFNGDNIEDLLIGARGSGSSGNGTGRSYVIYGSNNTFPANFYTTSLNDTDSFVINGINKGDEFGEVISNGDINDDGIQDILIGAPRAYLNSDYEQGQCYVIFGSKTPFPFDFNATSLNGTNGFIINGNNQSGNQNEQLCSAMSSGDINGDNIEDLLIFARGGGKLYVIFGKSLSGPITSGVISTGKAMSTTNILSSGNTQLDLNSSTSSKTGLIGGVVGGIVFLLLIAIGVVVGIVVYRKRQDSSASANSSGSETPPIPNPTPEPIVNPTPEPIEDPEDPNDIKLVPIKSLPELPTESVKGSISYNELTFGEILGKGAFGIVYKGTWKDINVAIKKLIIIHPPENVRKEFENEMDIMAKFDSPNIIQLLAVCKEPDNYCIVMEYMSSGSLRHVLDSGKSLNWQVCQTIALDIARGLDYLHSNHILHMDLKSLNVLLDENFKAKLSDFGLSKVKTETNNTTKFEASGSKGSVRWMAPELFEPKSHYTKETDVYSCGVTFWELTSRDLPFKDSSKSIVIMDIVKKGNRDTIPPNTPQNFAELIELCWDQNPKKRPNTKEIVNKLEQLINDDTTPEPKDNYRNNFDSSGFQ